MSRKIILNLAMSLDGFIAKEGGSFEWIIGDNDKSHDTKVKFDFSKFLETVDVAVMGKLAFLDAPKEGMAMFEGKTIYVATNEAIETQYKNVKFFKGDLVKQIKELQKEEGKNIWIYGGAGVADAFIKANIIDEYIIGIIPTILGKGRSLFLENNPELKLHLQETTVQEGIVINRYKKSSFLNDRERIIKKHPEKRV